MSKNQTCRHEGPLTPDRSRTVDEEISTKVIDFLDRNDPKKTDKPFFVWYNPGRMHVTTALPPKREAMLGVRDRKDRGIPQNEAAIYGLLMKASCETILTIAADLQASRHPHRHHRRAAHLGLSQGPIIRMSIMIAGWRNLAR
jgi:hypothetical protein